MKALARLDPFDPQRFIDEFWRKRPCLIGGWVHPDALPLAELLATAEREGLPLRLITGSQDRADWTVAHGPLADDELPSRKRDWTVLVQEMDKTGRRVESVMDRFRCFLPDWMLDDIMISHAMPGGSVGAHVDAYDVFLVQARGTRHWQLAEHFDPAADDRFELALLREWQPELEIIVRPGETLYLPPGIAHHGIAEDECQTWSVGLRTPSAPELMFFVAECLAMDERNAERLQVPRPDPSTPACISPDLASQARQMMTAALELDDLALESMLAKFLTRWRLWPREADADDTDAVIHMLGTRGSIRLDSAARLALHGEADKLVLTINGETVVCPTELAVELARSRQLGRAWLDYPDALEQLLELGAIDMQE
jgi:50S ribosomal protein L16 3-hydroxylase